MDFLARLLFHLPALLGFYAQVPFWVKRDLTVFNAKPADDTHHERFHRQRWFWRAACAVLLAGIGSLSFVFDFTYGVWNPHWMAASCSLLALLSIGAGYWTYAFNPALNMARNLNYVTEYYVSFDPHAAYFPDRHLAKQAYGRFPVLFANQDEVNGAKRRAWASQRLQRILQIALIAGIAAYGVLGGLAAWLY